MHRTMRFFLLLAAVVAPLFLGGCVSKSEHEAVQAELAQCETEKAQAQADVISWQQRFDRENDRWQQVGESVQDALPKALNELDQERTRILEMVPAQVQTEVSRYLDEYFNTVMSGFQRLQDENERTRIELETTNKVLTSLGADTKSIGAAIDTSIADSRAKRDKIASDLAGMIDHIVQYDQTKLNCKKCPDKLKMRDKAREELLAFHAELMADLAELQTFASVPGAGTMATRSQADEAPAAGGDEAGDDAGEG